MSQYPPITELLPHAPPMVLLDDIAAFAPGHVTTRLRIREDSMFFVASHGVPIHAGLEYMAQTCGVYAGLQSRESGAPIRMGFLLGTRNFHAIVDWFAPDVELTVTANQVFRQDAMGVFDCRILLRQQEVASAQLTVYQADDAANSTDGDAR